MPDRRNTSLSESESKEKNNKIETVQQQLLPFKLYIIESTDSLLNLSKYPNKLKIF